MQTSFISTTDIVDIIITAVFGFISGCFVIGFIIRYVINSRPDKKKVRLENKVLNGHARIVALQKNMLAWKRKAPLSETNM